MALVCARNFTIKTIKHFFHLSFVCLVSNEVPEQPVISNVSGHIYEKRLILKYIDENGTDPMTNEVLSPEQLVEIKSK